MPYPTIPTPPHVAEEMAYHAVRPVLSTLNAARETLSGAGVTARTAGALAETLARHLQIIQEAVDSGQLAASPTWEGYATDVLARLAGIAAAIAPIQLEYAARVGTKIAEQAALGRVVSREEAQALVPLEQADVDTALAAVVAAIDG